MRTILVVSLAAALGCGPKDPGPTTSKTDAGAVTKAPVTSAAPISAPASAPPAAKVISPDMVPGDKPISVADLDAIVKQWADGTEVTVAGYPTFFIGTEEAFRNVAEMAAAPGKATDDHVVRCELAIPDPTTKVKNTAPVVMKGTLAGTWPSKGRTVVSLTKCTVVSVDKPFDAAAPAIPGAATPIPVDKLHQAITGWIGKDLQVSGYYMGITTSKSKDGKIIDVRIDLLSESGKFEPKVGCHLAKAEPDAATNARLEKNRANLTVKGKLKDVVFGSAQLDPCELVSL
jgi:hypothetical protein